MAETESGAGRAPAKMSRRWVAVALCLSLSGAAAAFAATYSGILESLTARVSGGGASAASDLDLAFVPIEPLVVSLGPKAGARHLRFRAELEVAPGEKANVAKMMPRIMDTLNGYLRAVRPSDLADPAKMIRIRSHMLHRVKMVAGAERVRDLLVTEFVLS